ncbi:MAG: methyltransferase domain-containing protein [Bryobacterales bacterium]|nr:methyltransferase domain-containing protein [Bryobacterales bacterium]
MSARNIGVEILDQADDQAAARNLEDLVRINRYFGGHAITVNLLRLVRASGRFTLLDVGAASGDHARAVRRAFPQATVVSADHLVRNLAVAPHPRVAADAFRLPFAQGAFDYVFCSLFLHHFPDRQVTELLASFHQTARKALIVVDLQRHVLARHFLPATNWLFGWNEITLADGPTSVQAGFTVQELQKLAARVGLAGARVRTHRPWFRLSLVAPKRCGEIKTI